MKWPQAYDMMLSAAKKHRIRGEEPLEFLSPIWCSEGLDWVANNKPHSQNPRLARYKMNQVARGFRGCELEQRRRLLYVPTVNVSVQDESLKAVDDIDEINFLTSKLTEKERKVIYWLFYQDKTQIETGILVDGLSRNSIRTIRDEALRKMRKELGICVKSSTEKATKPARELTGKTGTKRVTRYPVKQLSYGPETRKEN